MNRLKKSKKISSKAKDKIFKSADKLKKGKKELAALTGAGVLTAGAFAAAPQVLAAYEVFHTMAQPFFASAVWQSTLGPTAAAVGPAIATGLTAVAPYWPVAVGVAAVAGGALAYSYIRRKQRQKTENGLQEKPKGIIEKIDVGRDGTKIIGQAGLALRRSNGLQEAENNFPIIGNENAGNPNGIREAQNNFPIIGNAGNESGTSNSSETVSKPKINLFSRMAMANRADIAKRQGMVATPNADRRSFLLHKDAPVVEPVQSVAPSKETRIQTFERPTPQSTVSEKTESNAPVIEPVRSLEETKEPKAENHTEADIARTIADKRGTNPFSKTGKINRALDAKRQERFGAANPDKRSILTNVLHRKGTEK